MLCWSSYRSLYSIFHDNSAASSFAHAPLHASMQETVMCVRSIVKLAFLSVTGIHTYIPTQNKMRSRFSCLALRRSIFHDNSAASSFAHAPLHASMQETVMCVRSIVKLAFLSVTGIHTYIPTQNKMRSRFSCLALRRSIFHDNSAASSFAHAPLHASMQETVMCVRSIVKLAFLSVTGIHTYIPTQNKMRSRFSCLALRRSIFHDNSAASSFAHAPLHASMQETVMCVHSIVKLAFLSVTGIHTYIPTQNKMRSRFSCLALRRSAII